MHIVMYSKNGSNSPENNNENNNDNNNDNTNHDNGINKTHLELFVFFLFYHGRELISSKKVLLKSLTNF